MHTKHIFSFGLLLLVILTIIFSVLSDGDNSGMQSCAILTGCLAFHLIIWIASAIIVVGIMKNEANDSCWWFRELPWERRFYRFIMIRRWKRYLPTYAPDCYKFTTMRSRELLGIISQTEVVHEFTVLLIVVSLLGVHYLGHFEIIVTIAVIDFVINMVYVFLQRYNRIKLRSVIRSKQQRQFVGTAFKTGI